MKATVTTSVERTVQLKIPREKVAEWLRSMGAYITDDKVETITISGSYTGSGPITVTWEIGRVKQEAELALDGQAVEMPEFCDDPCWNDDGGTVPF